MGTLLAFARVCLGTLILCYRDPNLERPFRVRGVWAVGISAVGFCLYLFWQIFLDHGVVLVLWIAAGQMIYFAM
jgi:APA family basic amino acid/polyamine antiporter